MARKKTTLYVDDDLWRLAKAQAAIQGKTLGDYLEGLIEKEIEGETEQSLPATTLFSLRSKKEK